MGSPTTPHYGRPFLGLLAVACLLMASLQVSQWREYALKISGYQVMDMTFGLSSAQYQDWGAVCNTLKNWKCSQYVFMQALKDNPIHRGSLANLGMALAQQKQWKLAQAPFAKYFEYGGSAYDVMFWYAKTWVQTKDNEQALKWYYRALSKRSGDTEIALELVDHLTKMGRFSEALSVVGSFTNGAPDKQPLWLGKINSLQNQAREMDQAHQQEAAESQTLRLPALIGKSHYLPIQNLSGDSLQFFIVDPDNQRSVISRELWTEISRSRDPASTGQWSVGQRVILPELNLGPWVLRDVEFVICQACRPRLGKEALHSVSVEPSLEDQMEFLVVSKQ